MNLPSFEDLRRTAYRLLGDAEQELRSDWAPGAGPTSEEQVSALIEARSHIARAKDALIRATAEMERNPR